jgi:hypothetical protein
MNIYRLCLQCIRKHCRKEPKLNKHKQEFCYKRVVSKRGFPIMDTLMENSPDKVAELVWQFGGQLNQTKKGIKISWRKP